MQPTYISSKYNRIRAGIHSFGMAGARLHLIFEAYVNSRGSMAACMPGRMLSL